MARFPNFDIDARHWSGVSGDATSEARIRSWANPIGGYLHAMHRAMWGNFHYRITGKDDKGDLILEGGWQNNCQMGTHQHYRFVEGIREELDTPGEWWQDPETSEVLWIPDFEGGRLKAEGGNGEGTPDLNLNVNVNLNEASSAAASVDTPAKHTARDALECASYSPYPRECVVTDCLIYDIGQWEKQSAGVQISMAMDITVSHCSIYQTPRAGINVSEGAFGGHIIEHNDVFDTVRETGDHGSFNSWGRGRFWHREIGVQLPSGGAQTRSLDHRWAVMCWRRFKRKELQERWLCALL